MSKSNIFEEEHLHYFLNNVVPVGGLLEDLGFVAAVAPQPLHLALYDAVPNDTSSANDNELGYAGYARMVVARDGTKWTVSFVTPNGQAVNVDEYNWAANPGAEIEIKAWALTPESAAGVAGDISYYGALQLNDQKPFTVDDQAGGGVANDLLTVIDHALVPGNQVVVFQETSGPFPAPLTSGTYYWVESTPDDDHVKLSLTEGGAAITITTDGNGRIAGVASIKIGPGSEPKVNAGAITIKEN